MPAQAGIQNPTKTQESRWIPAFAGMTPILKKEYGFIIVMPTKVGIQNP